MSRLIDADELANKVADLYTEGDEATEADKVVNDVIDLIDNAPTVEFPEQVTIKCDTEEDKQKLLLALRNVRAIGVVEEERPHGECKTCRHRDPEDKKCDCGGLERQGCSFPVSDDYFCKFYEKGGAV